MKPMTARDSLMGRRLLPVGLALFCFAWGSMASAQWPQWGGPSRDFQVLSSGLADSWPEEGPKELWRRDLGTHGHSAIVVDNGVLYTAYRDGEQDVVLAADPDSGKTLWEHRYDAPLPEGFNDQFGPGPHASPLAASGRIFTVSATLLLTAVDAAEGTELWTKDLAAEMGAPNGGRGYGPSPLAWKNLLIVHVGGENQAVVAFDQASGDVVWKSLSGNAGYSSPILVEIEGVEQVLVTLGPKRAGLIPATGEVLWELDLPESTYTTMSTPIVIDSRIFYSSAYADGSRLVEVKKEGDSWSAEEVWYSRKMRIMHSAAVHIGNYVYGSSGDFGPTFLRRLTWKLVNSPFVSEDSPRPM